MRKFASLTLAAIVLGTSLPLEFSVSEAEAAPTTLFSETSWTNLALRWPDMSDPCCWNNWDGELEGSGGQWIYEGTAVSMARPLRVELDVQFKYRPSDSPWKHGGIILATSAGARDAVRGYAIDYLEAPQPPGAYRIARLDGAVHTILASFPAPTDPGPVYQGTGTGAFHRWAVEFRASTITLSVDGQVVGSATDTTYATGFRFGLWTYTNQIMRFDNVAITTIDDDPGPTPPLNCAPDTKAVSFYNFDASDKAVDASGHGHDGAYIGSIWNSNPPGGSASGAVGTFSHSSKYVVLPVGAIGDLPAGTVEAWIYVTSSTTGGEILDYLRDDTGIHFAVSDSGSGLKLNARIAGSPDVVSTNTITLNQWTHVAVTWDGVNLKFYLNGQPAGAVPYSGGPRGTAEAYVGTLADGSSWDFPGYIDYLIISNAAKTVFSVSSCVAIDEPCVPGGSSSGSAVSSYAFESSSGLTVTDTSGNNHHGTYSSLAIWSSNGHNSAGAVGPGFSHGVNYATVPFAALGPLPAGTAEAYINIQPSGHNGYEILDWNRDTTGIHLAVYKDSAGWKLQARIGDGIHTLVGSTAIPENTWTQVAVTWDGANMKLYVNGRPDASVAHTPTIRGTLPASATIGTLNDGDASWDFVGYIDGLVISNVAKTAFGGVTCSPPPPQPGTFRMGIDRPKFGEGPGFTSFNYFDEGKRDRPLEICFDLDGAQVCIDWILSASVAATRTSPPSDAKTLSASGSLSIASPKTPNALSIIADSLLDSAGVLKSVLANELSGSDTIYTNRDAWALVGAKYRMEKGCQEQASTLPAHATIAFKPYGLLSTLAASATWGHGFSYSDVRVDAVPYWSSAFQSDPIFSAKRAFFDASFARSATLFGQDVAIDVQPPPVGYFVWSSKDQPEFTRGLNIREGEGLSYVVLSSSSMAMFQTPPGGSTTGLAVSDFLSGDFVMRVFDIKFDWIDPSPPLSQVVDVKGTRGTYDSSWYRSDVVLSIKAADSETCVESIGYKVDNAPQISKHVDPNRPMLDVEVKGDGYHLVRHSSTNYNGEPETEQAGFPLKIDKTPPVTTFRREGTIGRSDWWRSAVTLQFDCTDALSGCVGVRYSVDGAPERIGNAVTVSGEGAHTVRFYSVDNAGNTESANAVSFRIDTRAPSTTSNLRGPDGENGWYVTTPVFVTFGCTDSVPGSGCAETWVARERSDGFSRSYYQLRSSIAVTDEGPYRVGYYSVDVAGNEANPAFVPVWIDVTPPGTTRLTQADGWNDWFTTEPDVQLRCTDPVPGSGCSAVFWRVGGGPWQAGGPTTIVPIRGEGHHQLEYYSRDVAGNREPVIHSEDIKVDLQDPVPSFDRMQAGRKYVADIDLGSSPGPTTVAGTLRWGLRGRDPGVGSGVNTLDLRVDGRQLEPLWTVAEPEVRDHGEDRPWAMGECEASRLPIRTDGRGGHDVALEIYDQSGRHHKLSMDVVRADCLWVDALASADADAPMALPEGGAAERLVVSQPTIRDIAHPNAVLSYPAFDAAGNPSRAAAWRVVNDTGNCCENYLAASPAGVLYDFGGTYLQFSADQGLTWKRALPLGVLVGGEGTVAIAPGGDVLGVGWDAYGGDRLHAYKYSGATGRWSYAEVPLHAPLYDRPWLAVYKGPFTFSGQTVPYVAVLVGGTGTKDTALVSTDGVTYTRLSSRSLDSLLAPRTAVSLDLQADADADWVQAVARSGMVSLGATASGAAVGLAGPGLSSSSSCPRLVYGPQARWSCATLPPGATLGSGPLLRDSRGWLHQLERASDGKSFKYSISADGGRTWAAATQPLPVGFAVEDWDFKTNAARDLTAVAIHAHNGPGNVDQDMVFKFRPRSTGAELIERLHVGTGDRNFGGSAASATEPRFDFITVAILPNGKVATSLGDKDHPEPTLAIEL